MTGMGMIHPMGRALLLLLIVPPPKLQVMPHQQESMSRRLLSNVFERERANDGIELQRHHLIFAQVKLEYISISHDPGWSC